MVSTIAQRGRRLGFLANLNIRGRQMTTDTKERVTALVQDQPIMQDPDKPAQAEQPVFVRIAVLADAVKDPRAIGQFVEADGRTHRVLRFDETSGDQVVWGWFCEAERLHYAG